MNIGCVHGSAKKRAKLFSQNVVSVKFFRCGYSCNRLLTTLYTPKNYRAYRHAARHLLECESLAGQTEDFGEVGPHTAYAAKLKAGHGRKQLFWQHVV
jgi:uncharacterized protein DUF6880